MGYVDLSCRLALIAIFLVAGMKLRTKSVLNDYVRSVGALRLLSAPLVRPAAVAVAVSEVLVAVLLIVPALSTFGFLLAAVLLSVFMASTALSVRRRTAVPCHCFGVSDKPLGPVHLWRNGLLLLVATTGLVSPSAASPDAAGLVASVLAAAAISVVVLFFADFVSVFTDSSAARVNPTRSEKVS